MNGRSSGSGWKSWWLKEVALRRTRLDCLRAETCCMEPTQIAGGPHLQRGHQAGEVPKVWVVEDRDEDPRDEVPDERPRQKARIQLEISPQRGWRTRSHGSDPARSPPVHHEQGDEDHNTGD